MATNTDRLTTGAQSITPRNTFPALQNEIAERPQRTSYDIYQELDLGPGGYAIAPSTHTRRGVQEAIRRKLKR